jgi:nucleoside-diphosphate-sugar epimerase
VAAPEARLTGPIAVTGGTGFIGSQLVHHLTRSGAAVRALTRRAAAELPAPLRAPGVTLVQGDVTEPAAVARLVEGASTVYHLAGCAKPWTRDPAEYVRVNVLGTQGVLDAARRGGAGRVVHTSTTLVEGADRPERILTNYQRTKITAEAAVQEFVAGGSDAVVVRPGRVYGPGLLTDANAVTKLIRQYLAGTFRLRISDGDARGNWVHVGDVVTGMIAAAGRGTRGTAYTLGGENASLLRFLEILGDVSGQRRGVLALPPGLARGIAEAMTTMAIFGIAPPITRDWVDLFLLDWPSDSQAATRDLGYRPRDLREGLADTVAWLRAGRPLWAAT